MMKKKNDEDEDTKPLKQKEPAKKPPQTPASRASNPFQSIETDNMIEKSDLDSNAGKENAQDKLDTILSEISASTSKSALQYKKLSDRCFFWTAIVLHLALIVTAMWVTNLDTVIEFAGAIGCSANLFLFPGLAYILALRKYSTPHLRQKWSTCGYHFLAWLFLFIFIAILAAFFYLEIAKLLNRLP